MAERDTSLLPFVIAPGGGRFIGRPDSAGGVNVKAASAATGGAVTVYESRRPEGDAGGPAEHVHHDCHEMFYVLAGEYIFQIEGEITRAPQGSFVFIPRGTRHVFRSTGQHESRMLTTTIPGGIEDYFEALSQLPRMDPQANAVISAAHGMTVVGPPLSM